MKDIDKLHEELMENPAYRAEYEATRDDYDLQRALIKIRTESNLTQAQLATKTGIRQSNISRIETGSCKPDLDTLQAYAKGCGKRLAFEFVEA
ncbi:MAG: helix-turn-helix transcriptional regulator [Christensenellaceae bacterium]|jgi:DNA-binding XRE family transcriptional regulator|nr:helix-turn-helix transcriptional regulator [Christensenellaceae bacterium]